MSSSYLLNNGLNVYASAICFITFFAAYCIRRAHNRQHIQFYTINLKIIYLELRLETD